MTAAAHVTFQRAADRYGPAVGEFHEVKRIEDDADLSVRLDGEWAPLGEVMTDPARPTRVGQRMRFVR